MSVLQSLFTDEDLHQVKDGIRTYIRLMSLIHDPNPRKWMCDEWDLTSSLQSVARAFQATDSMVGKQKYQGQDFNAPKEVKKDMRVFLLTGVTEDQDAEQRRRYLPLYYLVIEPTIELFNKFDHPTCILYAAAITDQLIDFVNQCDHYGSYDDALVTHHQVIQMINAQEQLRSESTKRRPRGKKRDPLIDLLLAQAEQPDEALA